MSNTIKLLTQAKINLFLDVIGKREDGYHKVEMIMQSIDLADRLFFSQIKEGIEIKVADPEVPDGEQNLVYQASELLFNNYQLQGGLRVEIEKGIPVAAGLAGGSTNAAATLLAINELWDLKLSKLELRKLGAELGADVPFCIEGGTALATGIGTDLEILPTVPQLDLVVVKAPFSVSTAKVYSDLDLSQIKKHPDLEQMQRALESNQKLKIIEATQNLLEQVTFTYYPELKELKEIILEQGPIRVIMSGSGPTLLAFVEQGSEAEKLEALLKNKLSANYIIKKASSTNQGLIIQE